MMTLFHWVGSATKIIGVTLMMTSLASAAPSFNLRPPQYYFENHETLNLLAAAMAGDKAKAKECALKGANPNDEGPMKSRNYRLRLLHYAIAAKSPGTARVLFDVGADPELNALGFGNAFEFAITLQDINMMTCLLDLRPIDTLSRATVKNMLFELVTRSCTACLDLLLNRGVPIDFPDDSQYTVMMRAMDAEDYDMAQWLVSRGASVQVEAYNGVTPAYSVEFHLSQYKVGSPKYNKVLRLKELMQERGAVFPPRTPAEIRAKRGVKEDPSLYRH